MSLTRIEEMLEESGLLVEECYELADTLAGLDDLVGEVPAPSAELEALFESTSESTGESTSESARPSLRAVPKRPSGPRKSALAGVVVLAISGVGATGLSAAANTLPAPLQHQVSKFSRAYLPFDLPEPPVRHRHAPRAPVGGADAQLRPTVTQETSRSLAGRRPAVGPQPTAPVAGGSPHPSTAPSPSAHASAGPTASESASESASPSASQSASPGYRPYAYPASSPSGSGKPGEDAGGSKGHGHDKGTEKPTKPTKTKGPSKGHGGSSPAEGQPGSPGNQGGGQGNQGGSTPTPAPDPDPGSGSTPTLPVVPLPTVPDPTPVVPDLPGTDVQTQVTP